MNQKKHGNNLVTRSRFTKIKLEWELKKMVSAYIAAEQQLIQQGADGINMQYDHNKDEFIFEGDPFGNPAPQLTIKEQQIAKLEAQCLEMEEAGRKLLEQENYELMDELKEIYELAKQQLKNLKR